MDIFAANERGANFLYKNNNGKFLDVAYEYRVEDVLQNGRGTALSDIYYSCLLYTSPSPRDRQKSRMPSSA